MRAGIWFICLGLTACGRDPLETPREWRPGGPTLPPLLWSTPPPLLLDAPRLFELPDVPIDSTRLSLGDVDGDGHLDVLPSSPGDVLLADGSGGFRRIVAPPFRCVAAATYRDLDADGHADVACAGSSLQIAYGAADGSFGNTVSLPDLVGAATPLVGDFDGDGGLDLALGRWGSGWGDVSAVEVLLHAGARSFGAPLLASESHHAIALDLDGDGRDDLLEMLDHEVVAEIGDGRGGFTLGATTSVDAWLARSAIADLDGDGRLDVVACGSPRGTTAGPLVTLHAAGGGAFDVTEVDAGGCTAVALGDVDGDRRLDALVTNQWGESSMHVLRGDGQAHFAAPASVGGSWAGASVSIGDLDGDGFADAAFAASRGVAILDGRGDGSFHSPWESPVAALAAAVGDVDGDGHLDIVTSNLTASHNGLALEVLRGDGHGAFTLLPGVNPHPNELQSATVADVDGDGLSDVVGSVGYPTGSSLFFARSRGGGSLAAPVLFTFAPMGNPIARDLDGDGRAEVLASRDGALQVLRVVGGQWVAQAAIATPPGGKLVTVGDFDSDGHLDAVISNYGVYRGDGHGGFAPAARFAVGASPLLDGATADMNGDGHDDLVATTSTAVIVALGDGSGLAPAWRHPVDDVAGAMILANLNHDRSPDVIVQSQHNAFRALVNRGDGELVDGGTWLSPFDVTDLGAGDLDEDGLDDLVMVSGIPGSVLTIHNRTP